MQQMHHLITATQRSRHKDVYINKAIKSAAWKKSLFTFKNRPRKLWRIWVAGETRASGVEVSFSVTQPIDVARFLLNTNKGGTKEAQEVKFTQQANKIFKYVRAETSNIQMTSGMCRHHEKQNESVEVGHYILHSAQSVQQSQAVSSSQIAQ